MIQYGISPKELSGVLHPVITVSNLDRSIEFYTGLLGFELLNRRNHASETLMAMTGYLNPSGECAILVAPDGSEIELVEFTVPRGRNIAERAWHHVGICMVSISVRRLDVLLETLINAGFEAMGSPVINPTDDGGTCRVVYCFDPDEITLCLVELSL